MAAMTWDSASQAFVESEIPKTYNQQLEAWEDTEGYEHNSQLEAWENAWPTNLWLYRDGDECVDVTGGWGYQPYNYNSDSFVSKAPIIEKRADSLYTRLVLEQSFNCALIGTANIIDTSKYTKMYCEVSGGCYRYGSHWGNIVIFSGGYSYNYPSPHGIQVCYGGYGGSPNHASDHTLYEADIANINSAAFAIEHICDSTYAPDFVQLFKLWLE